MAAEKKTYQMATQTQVKVFLQKLGASGSGTAGVYQARGATRVIVKGSAPNIIVEVIPPGCAC